MHHLQAISRHAYGDVGIIRQQYLRRSTGGRNHHHGSRPTAEVAYKSRTQSSDRHSCSANRAITFSVLSPAIHLVTRSVQIRIFDFLIYYSQRDGI